MPLRGRSHPGFGSSPPRYPGTFLLAFREAVTGLGWQVRKWMGHLVECADPHGREHVVGLENLFRRARQHPRETWPALITEFLQTVTAGSETEAMPTELASVADQLLVRLGQPLKAMPSEAQVWSQPLAGTDLCVNLVIDFPHRMFYVTEKLVDESGKSGAEWLQQALANLAARTPADCFEGIHEESAMRLCNVGDAYDSSRALLLPGLLPDAEALGCFVTIPSRDELIVLPISARALAHVHLMKLLAEKNFQSAPYPISDRVFWVHEGRWRPFPIEFTGTEVNIQPPPEFVELLKLLAPEDADADSDKPPEQS